MQFLIQIYDKETECITTEVPFEVNAVEALLSLLGLEDFNPQTIYELESSDIQRINDHCNLNVDVNAPFVKLRQRLAIDSLPYRIHTNRELVLMLEGKKPLSVFSGAHPPDTAVEEIPERLFDPYVATGRFKKKEYFEKLKQDSAISIRRVLYALSSESWRIEAYILLLKTAQKSGWSEGFERMEGSLLGYTDIQNDAYLEFLKDQRK